MLKNVVEIKKCSTKREQCTRITKCHGTFSKCGAFKTKRTKNSLCSVRKCCKFYRSCVGSKCNNKKLLCQDHKKCKTVCHKKTVKRCQKWRSIKSKTFSCRVRKCFRVLRTCCGVKCHNKKLSIKKHSKCHKNFGKCGKWMTKKNQTFNL